LAAEDYAELSAPEAVRIELWNGNLEMSAAAQMGWHSESADRICWLFRSLGHKAYRDTGLVLGARTVRSPDVTRFRAGIKPDSRSSQFPAADVDVVVEVISPETTERDRLVKPFEYARAGIPELWLVTEDPQAPDDAVVSVFRLAIGPAGEAYTLVRRASLTALEEEGASTARQS
jgi:Uma2 family endonuclease